jgi:hypothetical protein
MIPDPIPNSSRIGCLIVGTVRADLDVTAKNDRPIGIILFGNVDQLWHLRVVNDNDMSTAFRPSGKRSSSHSPVASSVLLAPLV